MIYADSLFDEIFLLEDCRQCDAASIMVNKIQIPHKCMEMLGGSAL